MIKKFLAFLENVCAVLMCILTLSVVFQILARMVFHIPATWTVEVGRAAFLSIIFLGMPILIYNDGQMVINMVKELFKKNRKGWLVFTILEDIAAYFFIFTMIYGSYNRMLSEWNSKIPTVEWLTYGYLYLVMLIGTLGMLYAQVMHTKKYITGEDLKGADE